MSNQTIVFGGGCFWCIESVFQQIDGVQSVMSGYTGGEDDNPTYDAVCSGHTGHVEVVEVVFDSAKITLEELLKIFFTIHDPTSLNRQGNDVGTQYRSAIFYCAPEQKILIDRVMADLAGVYQNKIVTQVAPLTKLYPAESYHQNYFEKNPGNSYCQFSIPPKLSKVSEKYPGHIKLT